MKTIISILLAGVACVHAQELQNQEPVIASRVPSGETGDESDHMTGDWGGFRTKLVDRGVHLSSGYIGEYLANVSGGRRRGGGYNGLIEASLELDLEKLANWEGGKFLVSGFAPHGVSISDKFVGNLFRLSGIDAYDSPRLFEVWFEQQFGERFNVRLGQMAVDEEFTGTEFGSVFLNATFGWPYFLDLNAPAAAFPLSAPGARFRVNFFEHSWFQAGIYDGSANPDDASGQPTNPHGTRFNFSEGLFLIAELGCSTGQGENGASLPGSYKIGGWIHTDRFADTRFDDQGLSLWNPATSGNPRLYQNNWGVYLAAEKLVWREGLEDLQGFGLFTRIAGLPQDRNLVDLYAEFGVHYQGLLPGRDEDIAGIAAAAGQIGRNVRRAAEDENFFTGTTNPVPDHEVVIEATYRVQLKTWWFIQPDVQYVIHSGGSDALSDALVIGVRSGVVF